MFTRTIETKLGPITVKPDIIIERNYDDAGNINLTFKTQFAFTVHGHTMYVRAANGDRLNTTVMESKWDREAGFMPRLGTIELNLQNEIRDLLDSITKEMVESEFGHLRGSKQQRLEYVRIQIAQRADELKELEAHIATLNKIL